MPFIYVNYKNVKESGRKIVPYHSPGDNSSLVLGGMGYWEYEIRPISVPTFQEKVTHSFTTQPNLGQNFAQNYFFSLRGNEGSVDDISLYT